MTHVEYIEELLKDILNDFEKNPTNDKEIETFRKGVKFGIQYVIVSLKNPIDSK